MIQMLDCDAVMRQLWDYLDSELTPDRMEAIGAHVKDCQRCQPQVHFERAFLAALAGVRRDHSNPRGLALRVRGKLRELGYTVE